VNYLNLIVFYRSKVNAFSRDAFNYALVASIFGVNAKILIIRFHREQALKESVN